MTRHNTRRESEGAEFLVLGQLLIHGLPAFKNYVNMSGYDIVATDKARKKWIRISVKSRWQTNANGFIVKDCGCDFVVLVKLNRGSRRDRRVECRDPEYFVFPAAVIRRIPRNAKWGKIPFTRIRKFESYLGRWDLIADSLGFKLTAKRRPRPRENIAWRSAA